MLHKAAAPFGVVVRSQIPSSVGLNEKSRKPADWTIMLMSKPEFWMLVALFMSTKKFPACLVLLVGKYVNRIFVQI